MGVASLSREARPFAVCSPSILTINKSQIKMGVASLSREAGTILVLALKAARGISCLSEEATPIADYVLSLLSTCDTPYRPSVFTIFLKKEGPPPPSVRFVPYSGYFQYEKKNDLRLHYIFCQQHNTVD
jgi:hypothetical protein